MNTLPNPLPKTPPRELLVSMAMRLRHDFGIDKPEGVLSCGMTPESRRVMLLDMEKLYEEIAGYGFYQWGAEPGQRGGLYSDVKVEPALPVDPKGPFDGPEYPVELS